MPVTEGATVGSVGELSTKQVGSYEIVRSDCWGTLSEPMGTICFWK